MIRLLLALFLPVCGSALADDVDEAFDLCSPCRQKKEAYDRSHDDYDAAVREQARTAEALGGIKYKGGEEYALALQRAQDAEKNALKLEQAMKGASGELREELQQYRDQTESNLENYRQTHPDANQTDPKFKEMEDRFKGSNAALIEHDHPDPNKGFKGQRDELRDEMARNQEILRQEEAKRREAEQVVGTKPPGTTRPDPAAEAAKTKDPAKAKEYLDKVIKEDPNNPAALGARAATNFKLGNNSAACADAQAALARNPNHEEAFGIKQLACNAGKVAEPKPMKLAAGKLPERAPEALPPPPAAAPRPPPQAPPPAIGSDEASLSRVVAPMRDTSPDNLSESAMHSKNSERSLRTRSYRNAIAEAGRALELNPRNAHALLMRATAHNGMKNHAAALKDAEEGLKLVPDNLPLLNTKAQAQVKLKDYQGALDTANRILELDPTNAAAWAQKAYALGGLGDKAGMLDALRRAASMDPGFQGSLASAINPPSNADVLFYFPGEEPAAAPAPASKAGGSALKPVLAALFVAGLILLFIAKPAAAPVPVEDSPLVSAPAAAVPASPLKGQYEFVKEIGRGGMGAVHEAFDKKLDRKVAVKRMREELRSEPKELERFLQEAKIVSHLSHPFIVAIHDIVDEGGNLFLVLDYVDGRPLSAIIAERKRLSLPEARGILSYVCQAVDYAHQSKVLHRDLKPSNIMVDANGYVKVMDFGLAREAKDSLSRLTLGDSSGTPAYMAPEQHLGKAEAASDIFSLGVCLFEMVTGQLPYRGPDLLAAKQHRQYTPPRLLVGSLPAGLDELMASLLSPEPGKRPVGAGQLLEALNKLG